MGFKKVDVKTLEMKPFEKIGSEWMLISAAKDGKANTMTASWGGIGVLWGKNVATVYIRPQRHTKEFVDAQRQKKKLEKCLRMARSNSSLATTATQ